MEDKEDKKPEEHDADKHLPYGSMMGFDEE